MFTPISNRLLYIPSSNSVIIDSLIEEEVDYSKVHHETLKLTINKVY